VSEEQLQKAVIDCARLLGWRVAHFRPARVMRGGRETWETPVAADGKGFPDLVLVSRRQRRLMFVELKADKGVVSHDQAAWLADLIRCDGVDAHVWRPQDWIEGEIERVLRCQEPTLVPEGATT